jgi:hypothetical protein
VSQELKLKKVKNNKLLLVCLHQINRLWQEPLAYFYVILFCCIMLFSANVTSQHKDSGTSLLYEGKQQYVIEGRLLLLLIHLWSPQPAQVQGV